MSSGGPFHPTKSCSVETFAGSGSQLCIACSESTPHSRRLLEQALAAAAKSGGVEKTVSRGGLSGFPGSRMALALTTSAQIAAAVRGSSINQNTLEQFERHHHRFVVTTVLGEYVPAVIGLLILSYTPHPTLSTAECITYGLTKSLGQLLNPARAYCRADSTIYLTSGVERDPSRELYETPYGDMIRTLVESEATAAAAAAAKKSPDSSTVADAKSSKTSSELPAMVTIEHSIGAHLLMPKSLTDKQPVSPPDLITQLKSLCRGNLYRARVFEHRVDVACFDEIWKELERVMTGSIQLPFVVHAGGDYSGGDGSSGSGGEATTTTTTDGYGVGMPMYAYVRHRPPTELPLTASDIADMRRWGSDNSKLAADHHRRYSPDTYDFWISAAPTPEQAQTAVLRITILVSGGKNTAVSTSQNRLIVLNGLPQPYDAHGRPL